MDNLHVGVVGVHAAESQVDDDLFELRIDSSDLLPVLTRCLT